ncbi:DUF429 domain-containing protein [Caldisalinibacter kiritimatiensis]|uniref:RelA/SpoT domain protein n=1 Tax=Caldisalinibacter kiritimatiensis TaxID=1304284 RepID=R1CS52_9FIRM|nr:DUF429 domain-containing protein [Caldisalinibacter kiritimatiensis]EOD01476.1 RelA/SpoT domain protein [Caldisalinibacter kiritimatiensis]
MHFIGIDLAWTYKNETGICVIDEKGDIVFCESKVYTDNEIAILIGKFAKKGVLVAIDAPLIVNNEEGSRLCDRLIMKDRIKGKRLSVFTANRSYLLKIYGSIRGEALVSEIRKKNKSFIITSDFRSNKHIIFETFPTGICLGLFSDIYPIKYKRKAKIPLKKTKEEMLRLLSRLGELEQDKIKVNNIKSYFNPNINLTSYTGSKLKHLEDKVDAFLCSYCAYWCYKKGKVKLYGDDKDGFILIPVN